MNNDILTNDSDLSLAQQRLAQELHFLVKWQAVALFVAALGLPFCNLTADGLHR